MKIRLTESELHALVDNCVRNVINEMAKVIPKEDFIARARLKHGNRYDYSLVNDIVDLDSEIEIICPKHGPFKQKVKNHLRGRGCRICRYPRLERVVSIILDELNVQYTGHYRKDWLDKQHLDFFIEEYNTGIECQGIQHFQEVEFFGGKVRYLNQRKNDIIKRIKCISNNVNLETISYKDSDDMIRQKVINLISRLKSQKENTEG